MNLDECVDDETNSQEVDQEELLGVTTARPTADRGRATLAVACGQATGNGGRRKGTVGGNHAMNLLLNYQPGDHTPQLYILPKTCWESME